MQQATYPVQFSVDYPDRPLDRLTTFFRLFLVIPIAIVLGAVDGGSWQWTNGKTSAVAAGAGGLLFFAPLLMIVFRRKYPAGGSIGTWSGSALAPGWAPTWL